MYVSEPHFGLKVGKSSQKAIILLLTVTQKQPPVQGWWTSNITKSGPSR
jgi:hypothetical protein